MHDEQEHKPSCYDLALCTISIPMQKAIYAVAIVTMMQYGWSTVASEWLMAAIVQLTLILCHRQRGVQ